MNHANTTLHCIVAAALILLAASVANAGEPKEVSIQQVQVTLNENGEAVAASIKGINFPEDGKAHVALVGIDDDLFIVGDATPTMIDVSLPPGLSAGEYLLTVYKEKKGPICKHGSSKYCDEFDLSIGAQGPAGPQGPPGKDGMDGRDGRDGVDGENGKDGVDGMNGVDGKDGVDGEDGDDGEDGVDGKDGVNGEDGGVDPQFQARLDNVWNYICATAEDAQKPSQCQ